LKVGYVVCVFKKIQSHEYFKLFRQKAQFAGQTPRGMNEISGTTGTPFHASPYWWLAAIQVPLSSGMSIWYARMWISI
jgi:hypothetical protein